MNNDRQQRADDGRVAYYAGVSSTWRRDPVEEVSCAQFAAVRPVQIKTAANGRCTPDEIVARARLRLGENRYCVTSDNCEHFCAWCIVGKPKSEQIDRLLARPLLATRQRLTRFACRARAESQDRRTDACAV